MSAILDELGQIARKTGEFPSDLSELAHNVPDAYRDFFSRVSDRINGGGVLSALADWICGNTKLNDKPFSFADHEFQIEIANDQSADAVVMKCSQVGLSELSVRISLALLGVTNGRSLIYVLPSATFASEFCKARVDPVIESSSKLMGMLVPAANSSKMKRLGNSILYIGGAATQKQAISRPAQALIVDEFDFCNMTVMTSYASRLRHAGDAKYQRKFSTPTVSNYGVAGEYERSSKKRYLVKCRHCGKEQAPDFKVQVRIPGFTLEFEKFDKEDLLNSRYNVNAAYIACRSCEKELDTSLADPTRRRWVAEHPSRELAGYSVLPFDLIKYNSTASVVKQLKEYFRLQDYWNFVHGLPFASNENQINEAVVMNHITVTEQFEGSGYYMGVDVGKTCNILVGKVINGRVHVVHARRVRSVDGPLFDQIKAVFEQFNCYRAVIDAGPDFTLGQALHEEFGDDFHQCVYVKGKPKDVQYFEVDKDTNMITAARTRGFDSLVQDINNGKWEWPNSAEMRDHVVVHLRGMKRVEEINEEGEKVAKWKKVSDFDHYMHAAFYLKTAIDIDENGGVESEVVASPGLISGVAIGSKKILTPDQPTAQQLMRHFGIR